MLHFPTRNSKAALLHSKIICLFTNFSYNQPIHWFHFKKKKSRLKSIETLFPPISFCQKIKDSSLIPQSPRDQSVNIFRFFLVRRPSCLSTLAVFNTCFLQDPTASFFFIILLQEPRDTGSVHSYKFIRKYALPQPSPDYLVSMGTIRTQVTSSLITVPD